jgi:hypothetical protein
MERKPPARTARTDDETDARHVPIDERHRSPISTTLAILDEMLCVFQRWAQGHEERGVLFWESNRLTDRQRAAVRASIRVLRKDLRLLLTDLGLEVKVSDVHSAIWSQSLAFWEAIIELEPKHMRRYGELPESLAGYLDKRIGELAAHIRGLTDCLGKE